MTPERVTLAVCLECGAVNANPHAWGDDPGWSKLCAGDRHGPTWECDFIPAAPTAVPVLTDQDSDPVPADIARELWALADRWDVEAKSCRSDARWGQAKGLERAANEQRAALTRYEREVGR